MTFSSSDTLVDHRVAIIRCEDYQTAPEAVAEGVELLGGLAQFCQPGERLLLKPNLLLGDNPERGVTTHPEIFRSVARIFLSGGARLSFGDSPGFGSPQLAARMAGLHQVAQELNCEPADFVAMEEVSYPSGILLKKFQIAKALADVDGVINLPKFKTHALMRITGAVKNLFGCLPGVQKAGFHAQLPDEFSLGEMLVDLAELLSPRLHIMDGVFGMEGNGPRNGDLRHVGLILLSRNPHALDHCVAKIMNLDPGLVPTLIVARDHGLYDPESVDILGEPIENIVIDDYKANRSPESTTGPKRLHLKLLKKWVAPRPVIDTLKCTHCGRCVTVCPSKPKAIGFLNGRLNPPEYNYRDCIRCYCCQEMCPDEAIIVETPIIGRLANRLKI